MSKEEWLKLQLGDYIYRKSDGWGGWLQTAPGNRELKDWTDTQYLNFKSLKETFSQTYPSGAKSGDHDHWEKMDIVTCTNALALARYAVAYNASTIEQLRMTTIL